MMRVNQEQKFMERLYPEGIVILAVVKRAKELYQIQIRKKLQSEEKFVKKYNMCYIALKTTVSV